MKSVREVIFFSEKGEDNTDVTLEAARKRAKELGIKEVVVASTRGKVAKKAVEVFKEFDLVIVTWVTGYRKSGEQVFDEESAELVKKHGGKVVTAAHVFTGGVGKAIQDKFTTVSFPGVIAQILRTFGEGTKVCLEVVAAAADAGAITMENDVMVVAGSNVGADTAWVIQPANSRRIFDIKVKELVAKPENF
jgi:hypothetical protein